MSKHQKMGSKTGTSKLAKLIHDFVGVNGELSSYSLAEGSVDAGDEDLYQITFHEKANLITFYRAWAQVESFVPVHSQRFLGILHFLRATDDQLDASTLQPLLEALECQKRRFKNASPINEILVNYRQVA